MYTYRLIINKNTNSNPYHFNYGHSRNIGLRVGKQCAEIEKSFTKDYRPQIFENRCYFVNMLKEGIKRANLIHILKLEKPIKIDTIELEVSDKSGILERINMIDSFILYSMVTKKLLRPINPDLKSDGVIQSILNFQKSKDELSREISSVYAYLYSKTKIYETERFNYLWMALNGMYAALYPMSSPKDKEQMQQLVIRFNLGKEVFSMKSRPKAGMAAMLSMLDVSEPVTRDSLLNGEHQEFARNIEKALVDINGNRVDITPYGFLITDFAYFLRCRMFHANRPVELFSFYDDMELKAIRITNGLLEEFLDKNLHCMFTVSN